jgi:ferredoxin--NADP+ reductase
VTLGLNNADRPDLGGVRRPMSIASSPEQARRQGALEFYIRFVKAPESENPFTHLLWKLRPGDRLHMRSRPVGHFTLESTCGVDDTRFHVYVAAGTGLAPFTSIVFDRHARDLGLSREVILHGASYPEELGYRDELCRLAREHGLVYLPTVSRPPADAAEGPTWMGSRGRVEDFFLPARLPELAERLGLSTEQLTPQHCTVLICGLNGTIARVIERLLPLGFVPDNRRIRRALCIADDVPASLFFEQYDNDPPLSLKDPGEVARLAALLSPAVPRA